MYIETIDRRMQYLRKKGLVANVRGKGWVKIGYTDLMVDGAPSPHQPDTTLRWLIDRPRS